MASVWSWHNRTRAAGVAVVVVVAALCSSCAAPRSSGASSTQRAYERAARVALPSVVQIEAGKSTGSGVVFDTNGDIVTNAHVVSGAKRYEVLASAADKPLPARLIGEFQPDDLAVLRVDSGVTDLQPARWADSNKAQVGEIVLAMGSPFGLTDSVTQGIISATGRTVNEPAAAGAEPAVLRNALQTSAAINPGNSGGALVVLSGAVLGIPTLTAKNPELGGAAPGIGFAIPSNTVLSIANQLIRTGRVTESDRAALGITSATHTSTKGTDDGVSVDGTRPGGPAANAGIKEGDVITEIGGHLTPNTATLQNVLTLYKPGDTVDVKVLRGTSVQQFKITLGTLSS